MKQMLNTLNISDFISKCTNYISNQKQLSCKKGAAPKGHGEKRCEIQGGSQEMAVMVG